MTCQISNNWNDSCFISTHGSSMEFNFSTHLLNISRAGTLLSSLRCSFTSQLSMMVGLGQTFLKYSRETARGAASLGGNDDPIMGPAQENGFGMGGDSVHWKRTTDDS